jgi:hypothetical protein
VWQLACRSSSVGRPIFVLMAALRARQRNRDGRRVNRAFCARGVAGRVSGMRTTSSEGQPTHTTSTKFPGRKEPEDFASEENA